MNYQKTIEAILYIIDQLSGSVNKYNLMKILFSSDKFHLNNHAKPVTGDIYIRMKYGTVPSSVYNMIEGKDDDWYLNILQRDNYPFQLKKEGRHHFIESKIKPELDYLSKSDNKALTFGIFEYGKLTFSEVEEKNHQEKCWIDTPENSIIPFESIIEDQEIINELKEHSLHILI